MWLINSLNNGKNTSSTTLDALAISSLNPYEFYIRARYFDENGTMKDSAPFALSALPMMEDYEREYLPGGELQPDQRAWVETRTAEIDRVSHELVVCHQACLINAITPSSTRNTRFRVRR